MAKQIRILCVHGVGGNHKDNTWKQEWINPIVAGIQHWGESIDVECEFVLYDDLFATEKLGPIEIAKALAKLIGSGIYYGISDRLRPHQRGLFDLPEHVRWTAGMVVQWAENDKLRKQTRDLVLKKYQEFQPTAIAAHSLGSLICYDTFIRSKVQSNSVFLSFGSQIGNPFVRGVFGGRLQKIPSKMWYHLFNKYDDVLTAPLTLNDDGFKQISTDFDLSGFGDHSAGSYLSHPNAQEAWGGISEDKSYRTLAYTTKAYAKAARTPNRRAFLVGINEYPDKTNCLNGCLNDVFLMSSVLQETGFDAEDIRVVFDDRATALGIRERLEWLLDGVRENDIRFFFYSGHGAQIPGYGAHETIDRQDECLVPYDFDWTREHAIVDDELTDLYSHLPYKSHFFMVFDCCHAGGLTRDGGAKIRGLNPPDDIRHRELKWNIEHEMWVPRNFQPLNKALATQASKKSYLGASGAKRRLGRATNLRTLSNNEYDKVRDELKHKGPFMPAILSACSETELASEYRHGVTSYGAFTYSLAKVLRRYRQRGQSPSFNSLIKAVREELKTLEYDQTPELLAPDKVRKARVPWQKQSK